MRVAVVLALVVAALASPSSALGAESLGGSPVAVVRAYVRALDRRDARGVCATFAVPLRRSLHSFEARNCLAALHAAFALNMEGDGSRLRHAAIRRVDGVSSNPTTGVATVATVVEEAYGCHGDSPESPHCRPADRWREDLIYLVPTHLGWRIVRPGILLRSFEIGWRGSPAEGLYYPPGDLATVGMPAAIPAPTFSCAGQAVSREDPAGDVHKGEYGGLVAAPWLDIRRFAISRVEGGSLCFSIELAGPPRAASDYGLDVAPVDQPQPIVFASIQVDGLGQPHVLVEGLGARSGPEVRRALPRIGLAGDSLELLVAAPLWPVRERALVARASADSAQPYEPLLTSPLGAGDVAPNEACLESPTGKLIEGICGTEPSG